MECQKWALSHAQGLEIWPHHPTFPRITVAIIAIVCHPMAPVTTLILWAKSCNFWKSMPLRYMQKAARRCKISSSRSIKIVRLTSWWSMSYRISVRTTWLVSNQIKTSHSSSISRSCSRILRRRFRPLRSRVDKSRGKGWASWILYTEALAPMARQSFCRRRPVVNEHCQC